MVSVVSNLVVRPPPGVERALELFADAVRRRFGRSLLSMRLFGSFAQARANEDSDIDVAMVLEEVDWHRQREIIDLATDIGLEHDVSISPTIFDATTYERWRAQERPLVMDIEREGIQL
jgi:predicted nucleotidyltransferase